MHTSWLQSEPVFLQGNSTAALHGTPAADSAQPGTPKRVAIDDSRALTDTSCWPPRCCSRAGERPDPGARFSARGAAFVDCEASLDGSRFLKGVEGHLYIAKHTSTGPQAAPRPHAPALGPWHTNHHNARGDWDALRPHKPCNCVRSASSAPPTPCRSACACASRSFRPDLPRASMPVVCTL
jgi:hypothetical protein